VFNLTYEFKLKPTKTQVAIFEDWLEQCRKVYNYALQERKDWYNSRKCRIDACSLRSEFIIRADTPRPTYSTQCKALTAYRKTSPALQRINVGTKPRISPIQKKGNHEVFCVSTTKFKPHSK
jgi:putative transposase